MALKLIHIFGLILARCPEVFSCALAGCFGDLIFRLPTKRRRNVLANLHHAFPELTEHERRQIARTSCRRAVEMALFVLVSPHFSEAQLRRRFELDPYFEQELNANAASPEPCVAVVPHLSLMESLTLLPVLTDKGSPRIATIYRPLKQRALEDWVLRTRERFGMRLLSRKQGFAEAIELLRERGVVAILFDQNAGNTGLLTTFLGRVCSSTELPGMLAAKFNARYVAVWTERTGFWRGRLKMEDLPRPEETNEAVFTANAWFENKLRLEPAIREDWLWLHDRWRTQDQPERRLQIKHRRDALAEEITWRKWPALPCQTRIWIRMPNWLGDVVMAIPLVRAIRRGRPDAQITLLARGHLAPLLEGLPEADRVIALPGKKEPGQQRFFKSLALEYPDTQIQLTNSFRGDREAHWIGAPQRFGILRPGKPRPMLTDSWPLPENFDEAQLHQTELWRQFLESFGLTEKPDFSPCDAKLLFATECSASQSKCIGLICGTENEPAKRWPVEHWRALIESFPDKQFALFGTQRDREITSRVAEGFDPGRVQNRAGETNLAQFAAAIASCRVLVTNDTGGMHLANMFGTPVVVVFGPTNPIRTGPCFDAPKVLLQPPGCESTGGGDIKDVTPERVAEALASMLKEVER
ncbi:MAG: glycosyltransferase family 9 protein [Puniceicoccales bacterium]